MKQQTTIEKIVPFLALFEDTIVSSKVNEGETFVTLVAQETTDDD